MLDAAEAAIPLELLARLKAGAGARARAAVQGKAGDRQMSTRRGRPIGTRPGMPREGRIALVATLRAAAPWQPIRRREYGAERPSRVHVLPDDLRIVLHHEKRGATTIFVVDASGSSALHRLAEIKGAIELLLADCYVRRDSVALIAFRGKTAEIVLPPTRSTARARSRLAGLPGGGGTPLANGLDAAAVLAGQVRRTGQTPFVVLMTDGHANVARDGEGGRPGVRRRARRRAAPVRRPRRLPRDRHVAALPPAQSASRSRSPRRWARTISSCRLPIRPGQRGGAPVRLPTTTQRSSAA